MTERYCCTCAHWDSDDTHSSVLMLGGFHACRRERSALYPTPHAPDAGQWCKNWQPQPPQEALA